MGEVQAKIDKQKLAQFLREGMKQTEIAQFFGVTDAAVSKSRRRLNYQRSKPVVLEDASRAVDHGISATEQLERINKYANELLDLLMRWQRGDEEALQILESQARKIKVGKDKKLEWVKEYRIKDPRELSLKAMAEIRGQLALQLEILKTLYDLESVKQFQEEVLEAIAEVEPNVRAKIIRALKQKGALRSALSQS